MFPFHHHIQKRMRIYRLARGQVLMVFCHSLFYRLRDRHRMSAQKIHHFTGVKAGPKSGHVAE